MSKKVTWLFAAIVVAAVLAPQAVLAAVGKFSSNSSSPAVIGDNTMTGTNQAPGGRFSCRANGCRAVQAQSFGVGNGSYGIYASSRDPVGRGLQGFNLAKTGTAIGLGGQSDSVTGRAINGLALSSTGANYGGFLQTKSRSSGAAGVFGWASSTAGGDATPVAGTNFGVYGRNDGGGANATAVFGNATKTAGNPQTNGVWGNAPSTNGAGVFGAGGAYGFYGAGGYAGGYGHGETFGIAGESPGIGDGTYGLLSYTDLGVVGHLVGKAGALVGTCSVAAGQNNSGSSCHTVFTTPFPEESPDPVVMLTPLGADPEGRFWVASYHNNANGDVDGFTIQRSSTSGDRTFMWFAVGVDDGINTLAASRTGRARTTELRDQ